MKLLTREQFNEQVFKRDKYTCVFCKLPAVDAHHILDRKLWEDGGYYLSNGASVCEDHHWSCEITMISVEEVREAAGITEVIVPPQLDPSKYYDKWGNELHDDGTFSKGPLFDDTGCYRALKAGHRLSFVRYQQ